MGFSKRKPLEEVHVLFPSRLTTFHRKDSFYWNSPKFYTHHEHLRDDRTVLTSGKPLRYASASIRFGPGVFRQGFWEVCLYSIVLWFFDIFCKSMSWELESWNITLFSPTRPKGIRGSSWKMGCRLLGRCSSNWIDVILVVTNFWDARASVPCTPLEDLCGRKPCKASWGYTITSANW